VSPDELLAAFHAQVRLNDKDAEATNIVERDGPVRRNYPESPAKPGAMVESPEGLGEDPNHWISRQRDFFARRGQAVEWKTYGYDEPADLGARLSAHGFLEEDMEALILGELSALAAQRLTLPEGVQVREISADDLPGVLVLFEAVWPGTSWVTEGHFEELAAVPDLMHGCLVEREADGLVLTASWVRLTEGTDFAGLWGGSTHPEWRGRGLYRASVAYRARLALDRGCRFARVDASPDSRPILTRLGLHQVSTTTPYRLTA
jgi:GNAT superfamily N-acetyltransferase